METLTIIGLVLIIAGFVLVAVEMVVPGFGLPGVLSIICLIAGVFLSADSVEEGILITVLVIVVLGILMSVTMGLLARRGAKSSIILGTDVKADDLYLNSSDMEYLLNRKGYAMTDLRPAGKGNFDGIDLHIYSDGSYIEKGTPVIIDRISDNRLIVKNLCDKTTGKSEKKD